MVSIDGDGTILVGKTALQRALRFPLSAASVFKRSMGTPRDFELSGKVFRAEELSSFVLRSLKEDAERYLGQSVDEAIISVPAYFNDKQRKATRRAGELAGFTVKRIINEPTAAAITHGLYKEKDSSRFLVFDLGGGTFDISILQRTGSVIEVRAIAGDNHLGGENFTDVLQKLFCDNCSIDRERLTGEERGQLREYIERVKTAIGDRKQIKMEYTLGGKVCSYMLKVSDYEKACEPLFERIRQPIERSLKDAKVRAADIDKVVLVGGSTKAAMIRRLAAKLFGCTPDVSLDPDRAVALGAALQCAIKERAESMKEIVLTDVCPFTLGTEVVQSSGAFEQSGRFCPVIERNTVIPTSRTETFYTARDNQTKVCIEILQGESCLAKNNLKLGEITVAVPKKPRGEESVDVTYTYDVNSILEVQVKVNSTGLMRKVIIRSDDCTMTEQEAERRMEELSYLKISPRDSEENKLVLYRAQLLYEESTGKQRQLIGSAILGFEAALERGNDAEIDRVREELAELIGSFDGGELELEGFDFFDDIDGNTPQG